MNEKRRTLSSLTKQNDSKFPEPPDRSKGGLFLFFQRDYTYVMSLQTTIKDSIKEAMIAKDSVRLNTLRGLSAAFTNENVAKKRKPDTELSDDEVLDVIRRGVKQRKDSIDQFTKGGRADLAESEQAELAILQAYLPQMMSRDEIHAFVEAKKAEMGAFDASKKGVIMGMIMKELKGKADGAEVKEVVESLFS